MIPSPFGDERLAVNLMHFARVLRSAGLPVGPGKLLRALDAVEAVGLDRRDDFYWALHAVFVQGRDQREIFDQAFHVFWRNPDLLKRMIGLLLPPARQPGDTATRTLARRLAEALGPSRQAAPEPARDRLEIDAALSLSDQERLRAKDFEQMSADELSEAKRLVARLSLPLAEVATRRRRVDRQGPRIDRRASLRRMLRAGGEGAELVRCRARTRPPRLVVLCDISGSMSRYSRMLLRFMHALAARDARVHSFVFGTRLTDITRHLRHRDVDQALDLVSGAVLDWSGGTRIGQTLRAFNRVWARRLLGQGAVVLLITDGLDRDAGEGLAVEAQRLRRSCRRLVWLNPLLRWEGFQPISSGIRALLPHVDDFRPVHNLESLAALARALEAPPTRGEPGRGDRALRR